MRRVNSKTNPITRVQINEFWSLTNNETSTIIDNEKIKIQLLVDPNGDVIFVEIENKCLADENIKTTKSKIFEVLS